jgi:hypothetical protein
VPAPIAEACEKASEHSLEFSPPPSIIRPRAYFTHHVINRIISRLGELDSESVIDCFFEFLPASDVSSENRWLRITA